MPDSVSKRQPPRGISSDANTSTVAAALIAESNQFRPQLLEHLVIFRMKPDADLPGIDDLVLGSFEHLGNDRGIFLHRLMSDLFSDFQCQRDQMRRAARNQLFFEHDQRLSRIGERHERRHQLVHRLFAPGRSAFTQRFLAQSFGLFGGTVEDLAASLFGRAQDQPRRDFNRVE